MGLNPSWKLHEKTSRFQLEIFNYAGVIMGAIAYGFNIAVFFAAIWALWTASHRKHIWLLTIACCVLFVSSTLSLIANALAMQWTYINYRSYPNGPALFIERVGDILPNVLGQSAGVIVTWTADAVLLWRCYVVWGGRLHAWLIVVPVLMWLATIGLGVVTCYQIARPELTIASLGTVNYNLSFWAIAVSLNMLLTSIILVRLFVARRRVVNALGAHYGKTYTGIAAILIESAIPYAIFGLLWIATYGSHHPSSPAFLPILLQVEAITPELIIFRIARGKAWTSETQAEITGDVSYSARRASSEASGTMTGSQDILPVVAVKHGGRFGAKFHRK